MPRIISVPLFFENREWQTSVMIYSVDNQLHASVHILNDRLARKLASQNVFVITANGEVKTRHTPGYVQPTSEFQLIVQNTLRSYLAQQTALLQATIV